MRSWLWLVGIVVACAAPQSPPLREPPARSQKEPAEAAAPNRVSASTSREPTREEARLIRELMRDTEQIRGLKFRMPIDVRIQDRAAMRAYVSEAIEEEDLARARLRYVALGLLDPALDVRELLESLMEEELIGYYDPKLKRLAVRDDVARALGHRSGKAGDLELRATIVHELVHALQDQHLGLSEAMEVVRTTDGEDAFGALVEGDATLAMLGYAAQLSGVSLETLAHDPTGLAVALTAAPERTTGALRAAPSLVREPLLFRYREGALFAARLFARDGFRAVDEAFRAPPQSTWAVLAPDAYLAGRAAPALAAPAHEALLARGYEPVDDDVLGSFELSVALADRGLSAGDLRAAWRGDRYVILTHQGETSSVWSLRFDNRASARKAAAALAKHESYGVPRSVRQEGAYVLALRGLGAELTAELDKSFRARVRSEAGP